MNRVIKFRAWDSSKRCMIINCDIEEGEPQWGELRLVGAPLMQFTGLLDKNGKEIWEGDVVKSGTGRIWVIKYGEWKHFEVRQFTPILTPMFGWYAESYVDPSGTKAQIPLSADSISGFMEIIGNIYENPDLLTPKV